MSNRIVPQVYRQIIDDVLANIKVDFDEYGMEEEVLETLQAKWEAKLLETKVADFARAPGATPDDDDDEDEGASTSNNKPSASPAQPSGAQSGQYPYYPPPSNGLALPGQKMGQPSSSVPNGAGKGANQSDGVRVKTEVEDVLRIRGGGSLDDYDEDVKPSIKPEPNAAGLLPGDEVIDSDLDDSDDELKDGDDDEEGGGEGDIVFCVYDKVQRVKNKWKTTFKDGMIHINGRDYLFAKCNGEFEW